MQILLLVFLPLSPERRIIDAEDSGRFFLRLRLRDDRRYVSVFELIERELSPHSRPSFARPGDSLRKRKWIEDRGRPKDYGALDRIA